MTKMIRGLRNLLYKERLKKLKRRQMRGDQTEVLKLVEWIKRVIEENSNFKNIG